MTDVSDLEEGDALLKFDNWVLNPGTAHIVHNAGNMLEDVMPNYKWRMEQLGAVCDLCRKPRHQPRLLETCFNDPVGRAMHPLIKACKGRVVKNRFATAAFAIPEARKVEKPLRHGFDPQAFLAGMPWGKCNRKSKRRSSDEEHTTDSAFTDLCDSAISSPHFWAWLVMCDGVARLLRFAMTFNVSCSCHWELYKRLLRDPPEDEELAKRLRNLCEHCPGKGRRSDALSTGQLFEELKEEADKTRAAIYGES